MRTFLGTVLVGLLLCVGGASRAGGPPDPRDIVDKAIKALGGEEKLNKYKAITFKQTGKYYGMGDGLPYTGNYAAQRPNQFRMEIEDVFTIVVDGDKGWIKSGGMTKALEKDQLAEQKEEQYAGWVASLVPLKDKAFTLKLLPTAKVGDTPVQAIQVESKGHRPIKLFFDAKTHLLLKSQGDVKSMEMEGKIVNQEALYSGYKDVQGVKVAAKVEIKRDGKLFVEGEMSDVKLMEKLDKKVFAEP